VATTTRSINRIKTAPEPDREWNDPTANPDKANAEIAKVLAEANASAMPTVSFPSNDIVVLPGGLIREGKVIKDIEVRELTGEDEESLARASQSLNPFTFLDRLLRCGVTRIGNEPPSENDKLLGQMLIGDREAIILGIREATYGTDLKVEDWMCSNCGVKSELEMELSDIPVTKMPDPMNDATFKVPMRKGGFALVRLVTGADQIAIFEKPELTQAQRETVLLSRCVVSVTDKAGIEHSMAAFPSLSLSMSVPDRHAILKQLRDRQPGPKYDQVKYKCESCNEDVNVTVTIGHLFLDFGWI